MTRLDMSSGRSEVGCPTLRGNRLSPCWCMRTSAQPRLNHISLIKSIFDVITTPPGQLQLPPDFRERDRGGNSHRLIAIVMAPYTNPPSNTTPSAT